MSAKRSQSATSAKKQVMLALQGGGSHGAFTWGVLDQLLLDDRLEFSAISATSGGALNAVAMASGLLQGGNEGARQQLHSLWKKMSVAASLLPLQFSLVDKMLSNVGLDFTASSLALDAVTRLFSPYQFNLFDLNPIRAIVQEVSDFELIQRSKSPRLFINATEVRSGKTHQFMNPQITLETVMAAACLPYIFKTVQIGETAYWDGGYCGNPALSNMCRQVPYQDLILVQNTPFAAPDVPTKAADIMDRMTEISFNAALMQELRSIYQQNKLIEKGLIKDRSFRPIHLHVIESQELLTGLGRASKLNADWDFLVYLHDLGAQAAQDWLGAHEKKLGHASSIDWEELLF